MNFMNSLVYSYLSDVGTKLAEKFKKETKAEPMPPGSPTIQKVIEHYKASPGSKRKAENGEAKIINGSAKKAKKEDSSSDDDSSDEDKKSKPQVNGKPKVNGKAVTPKKVESSSDDSSDEEEEEKPAVKTPAKATLAKTPVKKEESSSDDSSDEEEATKAAPVSKAPVKEESSEDSDSDEDEKPAVKAAPAKPAAKEESSDDSESSDEEEEAKPVAKAVKKKKESSSDDSSDSDEDEPPKKKTKPSAVEEEPEIKITSNKGKKEDALTPSKPDQNKSLNQSGYTGPEQGSKIFIHNVAETTDYDSFEPLVEKFGTVTDFFNPGRGFAFITFSSPEEAQACIAAMDNTEVAGQSIQMNIAKPKGEKGGLGGKGRPQPAEGCKLFVYGVTQETANSDLQAAFEKFGTVTDAYNPGKGFAFIAFTSPGEAQAAMEGMEGGEVGGNVVNV